MPAAIVVLFVAVASVLGWAYVAKLPLPQGSITLENLAAQDFESLSDLSYLPSLTTGGIFGHNVRVLLLAAPLALVTLGTLAILMLMVPMAMVGFLAGQLAWLGYNSLTFLAVFILPHGLFEIPAAIIATAFALRIGASITASREGLTVGEGVIASIAEFVKVFVFLVVPLLLVAAFVEANITPQFVIWAYGG
jgi:stage II sporulation protein M